MTARTKRRWAHRLSIILASVVLSLGAAEGALRVIGFRYHLYPERIEFGYPEPEIIGQHFTAHERLLWVPPYYDSYLEAVGIQQPALALMGDSCTALGGFDRLFLEKLKAGGFAEPEAYCANLYETSSLIRLDSEEPGSGNVFSASLAVPGWSPFQGLQQMGDLLSLQPKVVTIFYGWNDHWMGFGADDKTLATLNSSLLFKVMDLRLVQLLTRAWVGLSGMRHQSRPERVSLVDYRHNLEEMVALARANGITPVLLTAPTAHALGREPDFLIARQLRELSDLVPLHQEYLSIVREVARDSGVVLCDLAREFEALPVEELRDCFMGDGIHFVEAGAQKVADLLYACFEQDGLLEALR